jgi:hypothetical protein
LGVVDGNISKEYFLVALFKLPPTHILFLLSNQVVQICNDIFEYWSNAPNVEVSKQGTAAAYCAWVTLQAQQNCMSGYLREKFRHHQALNSTFIHIFTHHMVDQSAIGLKSTMDQLKKDISEVKGAKATVSLDAFNKLDSKVTTLFASTSSSFPSDRHR